MLMKHYPKWLQCVTACLLLFLLLDCSVANAELFASDRASPASLSEQIQQTDYSDQENDSSAALAASNSVVAAPSSVSAVAASRTSIVVSWSKSSNAEAYFCSAIILLPANGIL